MAHHPWVKEFTGAVTTCDAQGTIIEMNDKSAQVFEKWGGAALVGKNIMDCHPEAARAKLQTIMETQSPNLYTIEKDGQKKLIAQMPWHENGEFRGLVEIILEIPHDMPHFVRS